MQCEARMMLQMKRAQRKWVAMHNDEKNWEFRCGGHNGFY